MIKRIVALCAALIASCVFVPVINIWLLQETNFQFQSLCVFFIIPIGSIIIGVFVGGAYSLVIKLVNLKVIKIDYALLFFLSLITVLSLYYSIYSNTYIDDKGNIVYSSERGTSISSYTLKDTNQPVDFVSYMSLEIQNRQISFFYKVPAMTIVTTPENKYIGWSNFIIEFLGYIIGCLLSLRLVITVPFCDKCKVYYKSHKHLTRSVDDADDLVSSLENAIKSQSNLSLFFKTMKGTRGDINLEFESVSCPNCSDGVFMAKVTVKNKNGEYKVVDNLTQYLKIKHDQVVMGDYHGLDLLAAIKQHKIHQQNNKKS